ncbi:tripartite tricarboxylate transporter TctB family protein [Desulfotignum balticum]|uniref:tripartite tricarboxylate transporter TctB family protein n=1 Tax=Desulfotignum balticum TaxID=115781 RepID=UPI0003F4D0B9|nr:tripartite tricarboxylate transporter TctB family protein [Desulfotignum balticum]
MPHKYRQDFFTGTALFIFSLVLIFYLIPAYVGSSTHTEMSPRFFPKLAAVLLAVLSFMLTAVSVRGFLAKKGSGTPKDPVTPRIRPDIKSGPVLSVGIVAAYFLGFEYLSFLAATPVAVALFMLTFGQRKPVRIIGISLVLTAIVYILFTYGLKVPLE